MNCIQCLQSKSLKIFNQQFIKSIYVASSRTSFSFSSIQNSKFNSKFFLNHLNTVKKFQIRGHRYFRRRPISVVENIDGKYMDDYVKEQETQAGVVHNDETVFPTLNKNHNVLEEEEGNDDYEVVSKPQRNTSTKNTKKYRNDLFLEDEDGFTPKSHKKKKEKKESPKNSEENVKPIPDNISNKNLVFKNLNVHQYSKATPKVRKYLEEGKLVYVRESEDFFYVEGWRLLGEALNKGLKPLAIFFSRSRLFYNLIPMVAKTEEELSSLLNLYPLYKTPYNVFKLWSSLKTPPGVIGVFKISESMEKTRESHKMVEKSFPLTVILDQIRDPNNLGSIFRTIAAAGVEQIILMKGCCDIWDPKVFRSTCGAQLHINCLTKVPWKFVEAHLPPSPNVFLADSYFSMELNQREDGEKENISYREVADEKETLFALEEGLAESEKNTFFKITKDGHELRVNYSHDNSEHLELFQNIEFPKMPYEDAEFFTSSNSIEGQNAVLVIGGETGLSNNAKKFALESNAVQVGIPLINNIESLNSSVVTGILVYAAQKQFNYIKKLQKKSVVNES